MPAQRWLWVTDYDRSLSDLTGEVGGATRNMVRRWKEAGHLFVILTGRSYSGPALETSELADLVVYEEGGVVVEPRTGRVRIHGPRVPASVRHELDAMRAERSAVATDAPWVGVTEVSSVAGDEQRITALLRRHGIAVLDGAHPLAIHPEDSAADVRRKRARARAEAGGRPVMQVTCNGHWIEYLPHGVNKAVALHDAADALGVDLVLATGDGANDTFLQVATRSAAVANAAPAIKRDASFVSSGAAGDGVSEAVLRQLRAGSPRVAATAFDETALDRFWTSGDALDTADLEQYARLVEAFFVLNPGALQQVRSDPRGRGRGLLGARDWPYRVVSVAPDGSAEVVAWAADRRTAVAWTSDHRGDAPGTLDVERSMLRGRWLVTDTAFAVGGAWRRRDRVAERSGRRVAVRRRDRGGSEPGLAA